LQEFYQNGILVGHSKLVRLSEHQKLDICHWVEKQHPTINREEFGELAQQYTRLVKTDRLHQATIYQEGDCVILLDSDVEGHESVLKIDSIIVYGPISLAYHAFVDGQYCVAKTSHGGIDYDSWTGQAKLIPASFDVCVYSPQS